MRRVAIIGVGMSRFGELWERSFRDIVISAGTEAIEDANLEGREIEAMYVGNMSGGRFLAQEHIAALIADYSGLASINIPSIRVEAGDASGGVALKEAYIAVASGIHDIVIAAGAEKVTDVGSAMEIMNSSIDQEWEAFHGATLASLYAMMARFHMHEYGSTEEDLAKISVKNHRNAVHNPKAQFRREISVEAVLSSPYVAEPLKVLDSAPISDGASVIILASEDVARKYTDTPVFIDSIVQSSDYFALQNREDVLEMRSVRVATRKALKLARCELRDIGVFEMHDSFTITEMLLYENVGIAEKGKGHELVREGEVELGGRTPVNPSGGLKACGHAVGATGIRQAAEIALQLRGDAGKRQVDAERGMVVNVGGTGATAVVSVFRR
ncbi:Acetyl-CoA acetyltransferase [Geoglobus ahangari]|uniref:Acetyl-CoA acetyltransferase n=1 Tax=Geoglobus ahangari TaxID=113653 RepID=A0A0F7IEL3_9EURY|nr:thiolase domain-containing protein [Geoglobus ahangari]AKG90837.1 Acetyl-CoA acetyltransferase [Geoglobus ahangari]